MLGETLYRNLLFELYPLLPTLFMFSFCLDDLSISESRVLKSLTINVWGSVYDLSFSNVSFMNVDALAFRAKLFIIDTSFGWIFFFDDSEVTPYVFFD